MSYQTQYEMKGGLEVQESESPAEAGLCGARCLLSDSYRRLDGWVMLVAQYFEVFVLVVKYRGRPALDIEYWIRERST